ncbi:nodulation protein NolW [Microvirga sp. HBU67558]|uniref:secretin N-terminal domain-containing protein n=1 Tax=Microvirga TaxID=186650 RepID=UPI001B35D3D1|nr:MULTISPECIES: secretin N-terminal domain-containing protein [unclassified Microvirga]MBQ0820145.1 nodulation protein NolW [Microvirga sp. HBU67558]
MSRAQIRPTILRNLKRLFLVGLFVSFEIRSTLGLSLSLPSTPYRYTVLDQDLSAALKEFGSNLKIRVNVSAEVRGRIRGRMPDLAPREFLDRLTELYDLQWYFDGLVLYVSAAREAQTRMLVLAPVRFDAFKTALDELDISDARYVVRPAPGNGLVLVSGPPRFVTLVEQTFNGLVAEARAQLPVAAPTKQSVLILFRGSSTMVVRDGRPEVSNFSDVPPQGGVKRESNQK